MEGVVFFLCGGSCSHLQHQWGQARHGGLCGAAGEVGSSRCKKSGRVDMSGGYGS